ncbi:uncharacterized protein EV420DRAFT_1630424 [Desarmillaria tabescens]|uniref:3-oxoacyl-[acyl-carrier-protein] reductase n=1 Tax=Armillaria tabescens TaxID=1929756 RepID=A0AA39MZ83_ARMTA|nr:uncharacterized protein EV420DRAFT_1630424 [Desarmillaria tabescens]KAK0452102.1 hypothetical protein EV420DRAFT_1630424 [Desarmillaria tabescens]
MIWALFAATSIFFGSLVSNSRATTSHLTEDIEKKLYLMTFMCEKTSVTALITTDPRSLDAVVRRNVPLQSSMSLGTAIITGSAQGIGKAIALKLARNGFNIALNDLPSEKAKLEEALKEIVATGVQCRMYMADVSNEQEVKTMILAVVSDFGGIDVMVANAGVGHPHLLVDMPVETWDHTFAVNSRGAFLCYKHAAIQMIAQGHGALWPTGAAYGASAAAVRGLTQSAALELGTHNITVNAYAPSYIDTPITRQKVRNSDKALGLSPGQSKTDEIIARSPLPQGIGQPEDVASVVAFLASKEARVHTTVTLLNSSSLGQCLSINE